MEAIWQLFAVGAADGHENWSLSHRAGQTPVQFLPFGPATWRATYRGGLGQSIATQCKSSVGGGPQFIWSSPHVTEGHSRHSIPGHPEQWPVSQKSKRWISSSSLILCNLWEDRAKVSCNDKICIRKKLLHEVLFLCFSEVNLDNVITWVYYFIFHYHFVISYLWFSETLYLEFRYNTKKLFCD